MSTMDSEYPGEEGSVWRTKVCTYQELAKEGVKPPVALQLGRKLAELQWYRFVNLPCVAGDDMLVAWDATASVGYYTFGTWLYRVSAVDVPHGYEWSMATFCHCICIPPDGWGPEVVG